MVRVILRVRVRVRVRARSIPKTFPPAATSFEIMLDTPSSTARCKRVGLYCRSITALGSRPYSRSRLRNKVFSLLNAWIAACIEDERSPLDVG